MRASPAHLAFYLFLAPLLARAAETAQGPGASALLGSVANTRCPLPGTADMLLDVPIYAKDRGSTVVARFTGVPTGLAVIELPDGPAQRAHVVTGVGRGGFAIDGWVEVTAIPLYAATSLAVVPGHVWIRTGQRVQFESKQQNQLRVHRAISSPFAQVFTAVATCANLTVAQVPAPTADSAHGSRGYALEQRELALFGEPKGEPLFKLVRASATSSIFFFGADQQGDWVKLRYAGAVGIDAWARLSDLRALPKGERAEDYVQPLQAEGARLRVVESWRTVAVTEAVPIRLKSAPDSPVIGEIEPATETLILDVTAGWASVLPKALNVAPTADQQFWVEARRVGIQANPVK